MKFKILSKKGAALALSTVLAFGSFAVFAQESTFSTDIGSTASDGSTDQTDPEVVKVESVTLNKTTLGLEIGGTDTLTATVKPDNATNKDKIIWSSSNPGVATVVNGKVTAKVAGTTQVTATVDGVKSNTCVVTVNPAKPVVVNATGISLNKKSATIVKGKTVTLRATVTPAGATNKTVKWSTSNKKIATVDKNGKVKGVAKGTAKITATTHNNKKVTCKITVAATTAKAKSVPVQVKKSVQLKNVLNIYPTSDKISKCAVDKKGKKFVTVTNAGKVTGKKAGTAKVTVTMKSGAKATVTVKVQKGKVTTKSLKMSAKKLTLKKGKKATLTVTRNPLTATEKITWKTSNKKIATVKNGKITAKKKGKATITAQCKVGKKTIKATCKVTVK
ncbi:MAG: hypothetical protein HFI37_00135 [Lachnospiraceae bacterium]|nr:hypothetical protein [Lachnospiraceae bacterium]